MFCIESPERKKHHEDIESPFSDSHCHSITPRTLFRLTGPQVRTTSGVVLVMDSTGRLPRPAHICLLTPDTGTSASLIYHRTPERICDGVPSAIGSSLSVCIGQKAGEGPGRGDFLHGIRGEAAESEVRGDWGVGCFALAATALGFER